MIELMAHALVSAQPPCYPRPGLNRQHQLIRKTEDYAAHCTDQPLRISHLCRELGVNERTLRDTFHRLVGLSPLAYLKTHRLNRAYSALRDADPTGVLIKQVALTNGFSHLGQFSRDYKQLFGELPSETLQRF
jgi:AraC family ethanolamine operon transcriptional activator